MKRYTGNLVIELEDQNTGTIETVSETNMVTNAVNDILGVNPMGVMYKAGGQYDDSLTWNQELLPICPNMIGGILLFPSSITEQADNLYLPSTNLPVAYASNDVFFQVPLRSRRITFICRQRICRWLMPVMMSMPRRTRKGAA